MSDEKLVRMAKQIADFFRPYPEDQAVRGVHDHLMAFWTPGMRASLLTYVSEGDGRVDPLVAKALLGIRTAKSPIEKETAGPEKVGQMGSDAG
jgi:formate dehydrogenase subunit delta